MLLHFSPPTDDESLVAHFEREEEKYLKLRKAGAGGGGGCQGFRVRISNLSDNLG